MRSEVLIAVKMLILVFQRRVYSIDTKVLFMLRIFINNFFQVSVVHRGSTEPVRTALAFH
jgi:hypothetical protein